MTLLPFATTVCTMCGLDHRPGWPPMRYCEGECMPDGRAHFVDASDISHQPSPHIHQTCKRCGFEWLTETVGAK